MESAIQDMTVGVKPTLDLTHKRQVASQVSFRDLQMSRSLLKPKQALGSEANWYLPLSVDTVMYVSLGIGGSGLVFWF